MTWKKISNVAMYKGANWDNLIKKVPNCTIEDAKCIALKNSKINFFFLCREYLVLEATENRIERIFNPGDAVFFSGEPQFGTAPQCDSYQKAIGIALPEDQYAHAGAPTEWWWHVGTLESEDGRKFGFEINAANMKIFAYTQIAITDVQNQCNYQKVTIISCDKDWAEYNPNKPWFVKLTPSGTEQKNGAVEMKQIERKTALDMEVLASFIDVNKTECELNLQLEQRGAPLLVWGTACNLVDETKDTAITRNNYYYSLTNLNAKGTIKIGDDEIKVSGLTWMDHEYGAFPNETNGKKSTWVLQDIQMDNGLHLSNFTNFEEVPTEDIPMKSHVTLLKEGKSIYVDAITTPMKPIFISEKGIKYFMTFKINIECPELHATFTVESLCPDQVFKDGNNSPDVYEGVASVQATFGEEQVLVSGNAWMEQNLG